MKNINKVYQFLQDERIQVHRHKSLKEYTTLHIGGFAEILVEPDSVVQITQCITICKYHQVPYYVLGKGSNVIALDSGYQGVVIVLSTLFHKIEHLGGTRVRVESGATVKALCAFCCERELQGLAFSCGIPGSVGGAIFMNAGAYDGEMQDVVKEVLYLDEAGELQTKTRDELQFSYRHSYFSDHYGIVLEVIYELKKGNYAEIRKRMDELMLRRREKQPLDAYSAGSVFKRPHDHYASALIQQAQLQGEQVGDAMVSKKHAGFLINIGEATSADFLSLIRVVQQRVKEDSGYELECEVKIITS